MRAVRIQRFGGTEELRVEELPEPVPGPGEVALRVEATALEFSDLLQRAGEYPGGPVPPFVAGVAGAGTVIAVGPDAPGTSGASAGGVVSAACGPPAIGARVAALGRGLHAEVAVVAARACLPVPEGIPFAEAAAFPVSFQTAYHALVTMGRCTAGETVLVHAAGGGLGTAAVQVARRLGLRVVAVASTAEKRERVRALGADLVLGYDELARRFDPTTWPGRPDLVLASVGGGALRQSLSLLAPFGRIVIAGLTGGSHDPVDAARLLFRSQSVAGLHLASVLARADLVAAGLERLVPWWASGEIRPQVGHRLPLDAVAAAHTLLASRESYGKIILEP